MSNKILMQVFKSNAYSVKIVEGDKSQHVDRIPHYTVEIEYDPGHWNVAQTYVVDAWLFCEGFPGDRNHEAEAWRKFHELCYSFDREPVAITVFPPN